MPQTGKISAVNFYSSPSCAGMPEVTHISFASLPCLDLNCSSSSTVNCGPDATSFTSSLYGIYPYVTALFYSDNGCSESMFEYGLLIPATGVCVSSKTQGGSFIVLIKPDRSVSYTAFSDLACQTKKFEEAVTQSRLGSCVNGGDGSVKPFGSAYYSWPSAVGNNSVTNLAAAPTSGSVIKPDPAIATLSEAVVTTSKSGGSVLFKSVFSYALVLLSLF